MKTAIAKNSLTSIATREQQINRLLVPKKVSWYRGHLIFGKKLTSEIFPGDRQINPIRFW